MLDGQTAVSVAKELGDRRELNYKWKRAFLQNGNRLQSASQLGEIEALKKRIRELEMENEILKKAALIFGREK